MMKTIHLMKVYNKGEPNEVTAVKDISLNIGAGDFAIIAGPSGSGKTTLLSLLGLLAQPTRGRIFYDDEEVSSYSDAWKTKIRRDRIGFIFQQFNLLPQFSAWENVSLPLLCRDLGKGERRKRAVRMMEELGLQERINFKVARLSVGEQQRVAIARALVTNPQFILADEPTASVDPKTALSIIRILKELKKKGKTIIVVTNDLVIIKEGTVFMELSNGVLVKYNQC